MLLYIDPGTGSMLFTIFLGIIGALHYVIKLAWYKIRSSFGLSKMTIASNNTINYAIFSDDKRYWYIFKPICEEFNKRKIDVTYLTMSEDDPVFTSNLTGIHPKFIGRGRKAFSYLNFLNATIVLSTTPGLDVYQWKRSRDVKYYIHIVHTANEITLYRMFGIDYYDSVLVSSPLQQNDVRKLESLRGLPKKDIYIVGLPHLDEMKNRLDSDPPKNLSSTNRMTILLAPTWGPNGIFTRYDDKIIQILTKYDYDLIIRPHPQSLVSETNLIKALQQKYPDSPKINWNYDIDNYDVLKKADILISDYSGVIFEFAMVHDKPVIYTDTDFDLSLYDAWWLDEELWTKKILPKIGQKLTQENLDILPSMIESCIYSKEYSEGRSYIRKEAWYNPGKASALTVEYIIRKYNEISQINSGVSE